MKVREIKVIERDLENVKKVIGYAEGHDLYLLVCKIHDLNNELGWANKLKTGTKIAN